MRQPEFIAPAPELNSNVQRPELLLASGWVFVALTGLFFKEFACFQRWEASALFAILPILTGTNDACGCVRVRGR